VKPVPPGFIDFILSAQRMLIAELYTFEFIDGSFAYFTNGDIDIVYDSKTFVSNSLLIEGLRSKLMVGFQVDEQEIKISAFPTYTLGGASFFGAVQAGLLDGAYITRVRAFWTATDGRPFVDFQAAPIGVITLFTGLVSTISKIGRTHVEMRVKSPLKLLDIDMPRNTYQPGCQWTLYDAGCTLNRASFTTNFTVATANNLAITPTVPPTQTGTDGIPNYYQGRMLFTSGANNNLQTMIANNDATTFYLQYPLLNIPAPGDTFAASVGCSKQSATCSAKFSNLANFRGFPRVPPIVASL